MFSVCIIVKNRSDHLRNVLAGIERSRSQPAEIIIVHMNEPVTKLLSGLPVRQVTLESSHPLPLAAARNRAAREARTDALIFLDVDCIPEPDCFDMLLNDLRSARLVMADPRYVRKPVRSVDFTALERDARPNPVRRDLKLGDSTAYELFWSLGFAVGKSDFMAIGGFDEEFTGYGGEDTDFAFRARSNGLALRYSRARIYHQNHPSYDPPLNWLEDIVTNAVRFKQVWGEWPMRGWLQQFADRGFIDWSDDTIRIIRMPNEDEIAAACKPDAL